MTLSSHRRHVPDDIRAKDTILKDARANPPAGHRAEASGQDTLWQQRHGGRWGESHQGCHDARRPVNKKDGDCDASAIAKDKTVMWCPRK